MAEPQARRSTEALIDDALRQFERADRTLTTPRQSDEPAAPAPDESTVREPSFPGYTVLGRLSQGGQGVVYRARQDGTRRDVAIKVLRHGLTAAPADLRRFEREIELAAQLRHPNIVTVFHSGRTEDGQLFYVMEFVKGQPLSTYLRLHTAPLPKVLDLFARVCDAVQYAHLNGVIHRDLKPANILVDQAGQPHVLDFGLARRLDTADASKLTLTQEMFGTVPYMSPEQARGDQREIDTRTDVYALGVILYELLTGRFPYPVVGHVVEVLRNIMHSEPERPSRVWTQDQGVPETRSSRFRMRSCPIDYEVETILLKALSKERDRRYQSVDALAADLRRYLNREPIDARRDSALYVLRKLARKNAAATVVLASVVVILISAAVTSFFFYRDSQQSLARAEEKEGLLQRELEHYRELANVPAPWMLGTFLHEWRAGRTELAAQIYRRIPPETPERRVMAYLLRDVDDLGALRAELPESARDLAFIADAERHLRDGRLGEAIGAYEQALTDDPSPWWTDWIEARLEKLRADGPAKDEDAEAGGADSE